MYLQLSYYKIIKMFQLRYKIVLAILFCLLDLKKYYRKNNLEKIIFANNFTKNNFFIFLIITIYMNFIGVFSFLIS